MYSVRMACDILVFGRGVGPSRVCMSRAIANAGRARLADVGFIIGELFSCLVYQGIPVSHFVSHVCLDELLKLVAS